MLESARGLLACPVCGAVLTLEDGTASCRAGHSFDVARQGYLNLLAGPPPAHADTPAMVAARERVLAAGFFDTVARDVAGRFRNVRTVAEVGAGTGFHLAHILDAHPAARGVALDVSVAAAKRSARAHPRMASVVADVWRGLPLRQGRLDALACVFAPRNFGDFARVLTDGGLLVVVTPNAGHLATLRARHHLLDIDPDKDERLERSASGLFEALLRKRLTHRAEATADQIRDLIAMGPNAHHGLPAEVAAGPVEVDVTVRVFRVRRP